MRGREEKWGKSREGRRGKEEAVAPSPLPKQNLGLYSLDKLIWKYLLESQKFFYDYSIHEETEDIDVEIPHVDPAEVSSGRVSDLVFDDARNGSSKEDHVDALEDGD
ncbi:hypothetical protein RHMOL_Rhmol04G0200700 [Rhododendron molle]|uniref:Uncharacterized protein n=1 Tax=Rhododendron molle TaxID=49168 RepID=A0ACC0P4X0_RHOML|nr:hypothetical protein RHMOL_Rhmol04G0200700 [Rhododendron molle]